jgi:hypothetical protein
MQDFILTPYRVQTGRHSPWLLEAFEETSTVLDLPEVKSSGPLQVHRNASTLLEEATADACIQRIAVGAPSLILPFL